MTQFAFITPDSKPPVPAEQLAKSSGQNWRVNMPDQPASSKYERLDVLTLGLDQSGTPLLLLDANSDIWHINPAAHNMLRRSAISSLRQNKIHIRRKEDAAALYKAIAQLRHLPSKAHAASTITKLHSREGAVVASLLMRTLTPHGPPGFIVLRIADFTTRPVRQTTWIESLFGLTPTEGKVAGGLLEGLSVNEIATREGNAVETVRGHVKRALTKVSARSQTQFVNMLMHAHIALINPDADDHAGIHRPSFQKSPRT